RCTERIGEACGYARRGGGGSAAMRHHEWAIHDRERIHVEDVSPWLRAGQAVVDEIQVRLPDLVGMCGPEREVALERIRECAWVAERPHLRRQCPERVPHVGIDLFIACRRLQRSAPTEYRPDRRTHGPRVQRSQRR